METEKNLVQRIFNEKAKDDSNSKDLARTLEVLSKTVFGDVNRFVFELLQNADDAATSDSRSIDVEFRLLDNFILFSHNGEHFSSNDVEGISSVASRKGDKDKAQEKTGYKGIGFKSVFGSSTYAHIISGAYSFRFDKGYHHWDGTPEHYPWQVIPIWTDQPHQEVKPSLDPDRVTTILDVSNRDQLQQEILEVFDDCQIILFLRRVSKISFFDHDELVFEIEKQPGEDGIIELHKDGALHSCWQVDSFEVIIPAELTAQLNKLDDSQCPQKLREATKTQLTFAAPIKNGKIDPLTESVIYSYLPTKADLGFAYLINGDFLMDARRTELLSGVWNEFLFSKIADLQLKWMITLQNKSYRNEVLKLIRTRFTGTASGFRKAFNEQLLLSAASVAFVSDRDNLGYYTVSRSIVDTTRFCEFFSEQRLRDYLQLESSYRVADYDYLSVSKLVDLGGKSFVQDDVFKMIKAGFFSGWEDSMALSRFLFFGAKNFNSNNWDRNCEVTDFLTDHNEVMRSPKAIFFPLKEEQDMPDIDQSELCFVHQQILAICEQYNYKELLDWLDSLGVREPREPEIAKKSILPMIRKDKITQANSVKLTQLLVRVHTGKGFSDEDYQQMSEMKLISSKGFTLAKECYLTPLYGGDQELMEVLADSDFVSEEYTADIDQEEVPHFRTFFKKIGCSDTIEVKPIEEAIERGELEGLYPESGQFFSWLERTAVLPSIYHSYRYSGQHRYARFTRVDFLEKLKEPEFAKFFWNSEFNNWDVFQKNVSGGTYYYRGGNVSTISFIQYYAMLHPIVPCTDGKCRPGKSVFSPALKNIIGSYLPVADLSSGITAAQRDFLGLKRTISATECLQILSSLSSEAVSPDSIKQIHAVYGQMVGLAGDNDHELAKEITAWKLSAKLLASDNTFQPAKQLHCFDVPGLSGSPDSSYFVKLPATLSHDEKLAFCKLFKVQLVTASKLEFLVENGQQDQVLPARLRKRLAHFALLKSKETSEVFQQVLDKMAKILARTRFFQADSLSYVFRDQDSSVLFENNIYSISKAEGFYFVGQSGKLRTLYELAEPLCELMGIEEFVKEVQFLMLWNDQEAEEWLQEHGYPAELLQTAVIQTDLFDEQEDKAESDTTGEQQQEPIGNDNDFEYPNDLGDQPFTPDVHPDEIDLSGVHPVAKKYTPGYTPATTSYARPTDEQFTSDVGRWTEEFVYKYLIENPDVFQDVIWVNQQQESGLPYDFECLENGSKLFIDAKGTPSPEKSEIYVSANEWKFIFDQGEHYSIFRLYRAGHSNYRFERIDNLAEKISKAEVLPSSMGLIV